MSYNPNINPPPAPLPPPPPPGPVPAADLGLLAGLAGTWKGTGFNAIWRPNQLSTGQDRFLELNLTEEVLTFTPIGGDGIPNRGLLQSDITMGGLTYLQQISDANVPGPNNGLHIEPGVWLNVPATTNPPVSATVARLASIPHGTTILAQGVASQANGGPSIPAISLNPFPVGNPSGASAFPEQNLLTQTTFRSQTLTNINQSMVDNPNSILTGAAQEPAITNTITLQVSTSDLPVEGGGTSNTAFLAGGPAGPNASTAQVNATFWLESLQGGSGFTQLQYSQTVILNFNGLSWPHVTVATLKRAAAQ